LIAAKVPGSFFYRRYFLTPQSAAFDLAIAGTVAALVSSSRIPMLAAAPYVWSVGRRAVAWRTRAPAVAAVEVLADAVGFAALGVGSVRARALVL
jgi:hypothetical protein